MALFPPGPGGGKEVEHGYKGKGSLLHLITDREGKPLGITTPSAKGNERVQALSLLDQIQSLQHGHIKEMTICEADKGYDSAELVHGNVVKRVLTDYRLSTKSEKTSTNEGVVHFFQCNKEKVGC